MDCLGEEEKENANTFVVNFDGIREETHKGRFPHIGRSASLIYDPSTERLCWPVPIKALKVMDRP
jgi:hypothetical protein